MEHPPVERIIEALKAHLEATKVVLEAMAHFLDSYGEIIDLLRNADRFENYVKSLDDRDASLLFRAILAYSRALRNTASLATVDAAALAELAEKIDETIREIDSMMGSKRAQGDSPE